MDQKILTKKLELYGIKDGNLMFVDDTNLFCSHKNIKILFQIVNSDLKLVTEWFLANKLSLNAKKKKVCFTS